MSQNNGSATDHYEMDYKERPVTMGTLGMWIPIGLTVFGLFITSMSIVVSMAVSNATRVAKIEANIDTIQQTLTYQRDEQKSLAAAQDEMKNSMYRMESNGTQRTANSR